MYKLATYEMPFSGKTLTEVELNIIHAHYKEFPDYVSDELKEMIILCF